MNSYNLSNIKNHLYKYITIFMVVFCIGFSSLHVIKADGGSLVYTNYTVKWVYDINQTENSLISDMFYIDLTISFDDYYSGYIYLYHTSYLPSYICVGGQIDSNTSNALRVQFTDVNQIYMKFVFNEDELTEMDSGFTKNDWLDGSMFTFTSASGSISISSNTGDVVDELEDVNTTLSTISSNIDGVESYLSSLVDNTDEVESSLSTLVDNIDDIITDLSDVNSSLTSIVSSLAYLDNLELNSTYQTYISNALYSMQNYNVTDTSSITLTRLSNSVQNQATTDIEGVSSYKYLVINSNNSIATFNSIAIYLGNRSVTNLCFYWVNDIYIYWYDMTINKSAETFIYTTHYYDPSTNSVVDLDNSNKYITYIYGTTDNPFSINVSVTGEYTFDGTVTVDTSTIESYLQTTNELLDSILSAVNSIDATYIFDDSTTVYNNYETINNYDTIINNALPDTLPTFGAPSMWEGYLLETNIPSIFESVGETLTNVNEYIITPVYENILVTSGFDTVIKIGFIGIIVMLIRRLI